MGPRQRQAARVAGALLSVALAACTRAQTPAPAYAQGPACAVPSRPQGDPPGDAGAAATTADARPASPPHAVTPTLPALHIENLQRFHDVNDCARGVCRVEGFAPTAPGMVASDDGAATLPPVSAWIQIIRPGATFVQPRRAAVDLLGVVLVGNAALRRAEAPTAAPDRAGPWTAFVLPEGGAQIRAEGNAPTALLLVTATENAASIGDVVTGDAARARGGYTLRALGDLDDLAWAGGAMHARIGFEAAQSPRASLGVLIASDDAPVAEHAHPNTWELLVALSAAGRLHIPAQRVEGVSGAMSERDRTVTGGTIAYVPANVRHAWTPDGTHPLIAVQVYSPPGPEQRFRALAQGLAQAPSTPSNGTTAP